MTEMNRLENQAIENLFAGADLAQKHGYVVEQIDALEDMAQVYFQQLNHKVAIQKLEEAESHVPEEYFISDSGGVPKIPNPITPFWAVLGKTCLLRGQIDFERGLQQEAYKWWMFAGTYFDLYAPTTTLTNYAVRTVYGCLHNLTMPQLEKWKTVTEQAGHDYYLSQPKLREILDDIFGVIGESSQQSEANMTR